jgi:hypothetical protein
MTDWDRSLAPHTRTELHPVLHTNHSTGEKLLGLNTNAGEKVSLRLLTDDLDGLRSYNDVRRVLLHELTHNVFGGHGNDFKELNSQLNKEVAAFVSLLQFGSTIVFARYPQAYPTYLRRNQVPISSRGTLRRRTTGARRSTA